LAVKALHQTGFVIYFFSRKSLFSPFSPDLSADRQVEATSFYSGFQNKRYSVQQEKILAKIRHSFALKKY
jgi:hypothetical protein